MTLTNLLFFGLRILLMACQLLLVFALATQGDSFFYQGF